MIIDKVIRTRVNIDNPVNFCADVDTNIRNYLSNIYKNKCFKECFIIDVVDILNRSDCFTSADSSHLDVTFLAKAVVYSKGDILVGCTIKQKKKEFILCGTETENIYIDHNPIIDALQEKMIVPVVVSDVIYVPYSNKISMSGSIFLLEKQYMSYKVKSIELDESAIDDLNKLIIAENERTKKIDPKIYKVISETVKAYPTGTKSDHSEFDLKELRGLKLNDVVFRDPRTDLSKHTFHLFNESIADSSHPEPVELNLTEVVTSIYTDYYKWIKFVNDMCDTYNTEEKLKEHRVLWTILASRKKQNK